MATGHSSPADMLSFQPDCGKPAGKALPEKPNFSQTCSLLSQYLKEKGTFGDVSLCMSRSAEENGNFAGTYEALRDREILGWILFSTMFGFF